MGNVQSSTDLHGSISILIPITVALLLYCQVLVMQSYVERDFTIACYDFFVDHGNYHGNYTAGQFMMAMNL